MKKKVVHAVTSSRSKAKVPSVSKKTVSKLKTVKLVKVKPVRQVKLIKPVKSAKIKSLPPVSIPKPHIESTVHKSQHVHTRAKRARASPVVHKHAHHSSHDKPHHSPAHVSHSSHPVHTSASHASASHASASHASASHSSHSAHSSRSATHSTHSKHHSSHSSRPVTPHPHRSFGALWVEFLEKHVVDIPVARAESKPVEKSNKSEHPAQVSFISRLTSLFSKTKKKETAHFTVTVASSETAVDALLREVQNRGEVSLEQIESSFHVSKELAEEWAKILESKGLVELGYPAFGSMTLKKPTEGDKHE